MKKRQKISGNGYFVRLQQQLRYVILRSGFVVFKNELINSYLFCSAATDVPEGRYNENSGDIAGYG